MKYYFEDEEKEVKEPETVQEEPVSEEPAPKKDDGYVMKLPESEKQTDVVVEPNKTAHWMTRIAGGVIDVSLIFLGLLGFRQLIGLTPLGSEMQKYTNLAIEISDNYKLEKLVEGSEETFGYKLYEEDENYKAYIKDGYLSYLDEETKTHYVVANNENISQELQTAFREKVNGDENFKNYTFNARLFDFSIVAISLTCSEVVFLLGIPLINKRRATLGKFAAGTMVINSHYQSEAKWYQMVGRFFWILTFESLIPLFFISSVIWTPLVVGTLMFLITLTNKDRRTLHDFVCRTKVIEKNSFKRLSDQ